MNWKGHANEPDYDYSLMIACNTKVDDQDQHIYKHSYNDTYLCVPFEHHGWHISLAWLLM